MKNDAVLIFHKIDFLEFSSNELEELIKWLIYFNLKVYFLHCKNFPAELVPVNDNNPRLIDDEELKRIIDSDIDNIDIILVQQNTSGIEERAGILFTYDGKGIPEGSNAFMFSHLSKIRETLENLLFYKKI